MADLLALRRTFRSPCIAEAEWDGFRISPNRCTYLAGRFAAKEAFAKALGTGLRHPVSLSRISITNDAFGKPTLGLDPTLEQYVLGRGITNRHLTLSHERSVACAFVVLEGRPA